VLVATYETSLGLASEKRSEYFDTPWDWDAIKANAGFIIQVGGNGSVHTSWAGCLTRYAHGDTDGLALFDEVARLSVIR
jgi:hypothetical protein